MKTILVPTDFSARAEEALNFAVQFSERVGGAIKLMHIVDFPSGSFNTMGEVDNMDPEIIFQGEYLRGVHERLEEIKERYSDYDIQAKIKYGNPYTSISSEISEEEVDYIVMGSNGASGLKEV